MSPCILHLYKAWNWHAAYKLPVLHWFVLIISTTQVLTAAGVLPLSSGTNASLALSQATDVITVCTTDYLVPALAAGVDVSGLANLPTQCNFTGITGECELILQHASSLTFRTLLPVLTEQILISITTLA